MNITKHFTREEFTHSQTATRKGIVNKPTEPQWLIVSGMCNFVLEPTRSRIGPMRVSSGYRCTELNTAIGGSTRSDHMILGTACAVDIVYEDLGELLHALYFLPWSKLIYEYESWIHISFDQNGPPPGRSPWIKNASRNYENMSYDEIVSLGKGDDNASLG